MFSWKKEGLIFSPGDILYRPEWMFEFAQAPNALIFPNFVRVFFSCRARADSQGQTVSYCAYVDLCRSDLKKILRVSEIPLLSLGEQGAFDEFGTYVFTATRHLDNVYAFYVGVTRCQSVPTAAAIGLAISSDGGNTFTKFGRGPVLSLSPDEPFVISSPKIRKFNDEFYLFYISGKEWLSDGSKVEPIYKIRMATSKDGVNWQKINSDLLKESISHEAQAAPDVIYKNGRYHMFFCYRGATDYRKNKNNSYRIGYAYSDNLFDWQRDDQLVGIDISPIDTDFDSEMIAYPNVFELDGRVYMLYIGNEFGRKGFGLAEMVSGFGVRDFLQSSR